MTRSDGFQQAPTQRTHLEEYSQELHDDGLKAGGNDNHPDEDGALVDAREEVLLIVDTAGADLVEDLG